MKGITSRLQVFLAKIAGKDVDVSTLTPPVAISEEEKLMLDIADRIDTIEEGGGGSGLPAVTSDDNGDVLTVVNGAWGKAAPSGGDSDIFWCPFYWDDDGYACTRTFAEIVAAYDAQKLLIATDGGGTSIYCDAIMGSSEIHQVNFYFWEPYHETPNAYLANKISITASGITGSFAVYSFTPDA